MTTAQIRPRSLPLIAAAFLAASALLLAATATSVRGGVPPPTCAILISSTSSPVPAETATIIALEDVQVDGTGFTPNATLDITVVLNGVPQATFPQATDGSGNFTLTGTLMEDQVGNWTLTAADGQVCSDTVTFTVMLAAVATPTPEGLPDAAMIPAPASTGGGAGLAFFAILGSALIGLTLVTLRTRRVTQR
jgi:hypothetical protein